MKTESKHCNDCGKVTIWAPTSEKMANDGDKECIPCFEKQEK